MKCPDCRAWIADGEFDPVMYGSPLNHSYIYGPGHSRRRCPTMMARELQIRVDVEGGERAQRWGFLRHPKPSRWGNGVIGAFIPDWPGETLPPAWERSYCQQFT
jgi:hypothetical protein